MLGNMKKIIYLSAFLVVFTLGNFTSVYASEECRESPYTLTLEGGRLSDEEAEKLEKSLDANPDDISTRTKLLGYYFLKAHESDTFKKIRQEHVLWIIRNAPEEMIAGLPEIQLDPDFDGEVFVEAKGLWLENIENDGENTAMLGNAAKFFQRYDWDMTEDLFKRVQVLEPDNPDWPQLLGNHYYILMNWLPGDARKVFAKKSSEQYERALALLTDERLRFYMLSDVAKSSFEAEDIKKAKGHAIELLDKAQQYKNDWNYGNAIHHGNLVLGRISLKSGDIEKAKEFLIKAGKTTGSPQLNSFGPNMTLAKELLEKGEKEAVIKYFELCAKFWGMGDGHLEDWSSAVKMGAMPDFGSNLNY
jgi:tetratricopeptide (TPR) repeat protein